MRESVRQLLLSRIPDDALVLDIGGWGDPFERADWNLDIGAYRTRGFYRRAGWSDAPPRPERFTAETWVQRDICDHDPYPFSDNQFDFVVCSHTLEDIRDPVWACREISRIGKAGYIETPSRLEEQSWGAVGDLVGHPHHHWLVESASAELIFTFKPHSIHSTPAYHFPAGFHDTLTDEERLLRFWWKGSFTARERLPFFDGTEEPEYAGEVAEYAGFVDRELAARGVRRSRSLPQRVVTRLRRR